MKNSLCCKDVQLVFIFKSNNQLQLIIQLFLIIKFQQQKYFSFPKDDRDKIEHSKELKIAYVQIKNPNNPAQLMDGKLITYCKSNK